MSQDWVIYKDEEGNDYYYNTVTEETQWDPPEGFVAPATDDNDDNDDAIANKSEWTVHKDDEGNEYYYNAATDETQWDRPTDFVDNDEKVGAEDDMKTGDNDEREVEDEDEPVINSPPALPDDDGVDNVKDDDDNNKNENETKTEDNQEQDNSDNDDFDKDKDDSNQQESEWEAYKDEEGNEYFYNATTGETQWDRPKELGGSKDDDNDADAADGDTIEEPVKTKDTPIHNDDAMETDENDNTEPEQERGESSDVPVKSSWAVYKDDDGNEYYYNAETGETTWDMPAEGLAEVSAAADPPADEFSGSPPASPSQQSPPRQMSPTSDDDEAEQPVSGWTAHQDEEGREYYYNAETGVTTWDKPAELGGDAAVDTDIVMEEVVDDTAEIIQETVKEPEIDPAIVTLQKAREALDMPDSIMEPNCLVTVAQVVEADQGNPQNAITALMDNFKGQTAVCGLLSRWLGELRASGGGNSKKNGTAIVASTITPPTKLISDQIRVIVQDIIGRIVKEKFTKQVGDGILNLSKAEAAFLEDMMDSSRWRKLLIDLSASHKESAVLMYCLRSISKRGHHREIARRVNQSDHFSVFNAMLASELGNISMLAIMGEDADGSITTVGLQEIVKDLRRACTSTSYTYLYTVEMLRFYKQRLIQRFGKSSNGTNNDSNALTPRAVQQVIRKVEMLEESLSDAMVDPTTSAAVAGTSPLFRRRRMEVALAIDDLYQRQRKRRKPDPDHIDDEDDDHSGNNGDISLIKLENALLTFLRRYSMGVQVDDAILDPLIPTGLDSVEMAERVGMLLVQHPLAVRAMLGCLYKAGTARVVSPVLRNKCARLCALAVVAAERVVLENELEHASTNNGNDLKKSDEVAVTRMVLEGCQLCEQLESMVSFAVASPDQANKSAPSPGIRLCALAYDCAAVAQGVVLWVSTFSKAADFASSASFPTVSTSVLSLVRLVAISQPFTRQEALEIALAFLKHTNRDISYQKINAIKEQSLRLLIFLLIHGEVVPVMSSIASRLQQSSSSELDASLVRYFVSGVLQVVQPPVSLTFARSFAQLLQAPRCMDAVRSSYFSDENKKRLADLLSHIQTLKTSGKKVSTADETLFKSITRAYKV